MKTYSYTLEQIKQAQLIFEQNLKFNKHVSMFEALEQAATTSPERSTTSNLKEWVKNQKKSKSPVKLVT